MQKLTPFPTGLMFIGGTLFALFSGVVLAQTIITSPQNPGALLFLGAALFMNAVIWLRAGYSSLS